MTATMTARLRDYKPSFAVDVLFRLAVGEIGHDESNFGIMLSIIALIDAETDGLYSEEEIGRHAARLMQSYVTEWMVDPW